MTIRTNKEVSHPFLIGMNDKIWPVFSFQHIDASFGCYEVPCGHKCHTDCYLNMLLDNM